RKIPFDNIINTRFNGLKQKIQLAGSNIIELVIRAKFIINYYILMDTTRAPPPATFSQNFWYSICKLVNDQRVTNI
ncbi:hypothetical protein BD408DRAFT_338088, partial [Parasitella parasitica]